MKITERLQERLQTNREEILARQREIEAELPDRGRRSRNGRPHAGWCVPGRSGWTRAVKTAGLPWDHYWSGSLPTPSTQIPQAVADFLAALTD